MACVSSAATTTINTNTGLSRSMSIKINTNNGPSLNPLPASDIRLFVTNLRLLDLDLREDWPDIAVHTFSAKLADQKQRISGTEWALFRLFEIWNANETAQKLQPFFPPLEPLQSLNLRAALFRCLNELKKDGLLGRESVLRKTMLDECKGDKFYEILALFSTAVLKRSLASGQSHPNDTAVANRWATASVLSLHQQHSLPPLAIAHKAALVNLLRKKEEKRRRYTHFQRLLSSKAGDIKSHLRMINDTSGPNTSNISQKQAKAIKKELNDNWIGNQKWLHVMLHGDQVPAEDAFLGCRFDTVWHMVDNGQKLEHTSPKIGLLESLQVRVAEQQARLQNWKAFHEDLRQDIMQDETSTRSKSSVNVQELKFDNHLKFQLPITKHQGTVEVVQRRDLRAEYQLILSEMDVELFRVEEAKQQRPTVSLTRRRTSSFAHNPSLALNRTNTRSTSTSTIVNPIMMMENTLISKESRPVNRSLITPAPDEVPLAATPADSDVTLVGNMTVLRNTSLGSNLADQPIMTIKQHTDPAPSMSYLTISESSPPPVLFHPSQANQKSLASCSLPNLPSEAPKPILEQPGLDPNEALAERIITSISNATPSPVKKSQPRMSLSLLERTRMSMARTNSFEPVSESPDLPLPSLSPPPPVEETETDRRATLLERTRLSMVAMQNKPRKSLSARETKEKRKSRQSLFPINQFDTPRNRKSFELIEEIKSIERTPTEALFDDTVDYDRVFKSRPRIATSPVFSPAGGEASDEEVYEDGVTGIDLGDVDQDEEGEGFTMTWADSPSRRVGTRH